MDIIDREIGNLYNTRLGIRSRKVPGKRKVHEIIIPLKLSVINDWQRIVKKKGNAVQVFTELVEARRREDRRIKQEKRDAKEGLQSAA